MISDTFIFFLWPEAQPEETPAGPSLFDQLAVSSEDPAVLTIETDMVQLLDSKTEESYQPASITWPGIEQPFAIELRPRGITRRKICDFPPLKLNFNKKELRAAGLYGDYDKLKLVSECQLDEKLLLREYLAYCLYNEMTDRSFRAHLVNPA